MMGDLSHHHLSDLIGRIYDCTLDPGLWEPTLDGIKGLLQCKGAQLFLNDARHHRTIMQKKSGLDSYWLDQQQRFIPNIHAGMAQLFDNGLSIDEPFLLTRHTSPGFFDTSPYFHEWNRPQGYVDGAELTLMRSPTRWSGLCLHRHESIGGFTERDTEIMRLLTPHVRRAVTISNVLDARALELARVTETLNALKFGIILANEDGRILHANRAAEDMMRGDGPLRDRAGHLQTEKLRASAEIKAAIGLAARDETGLGKEGIAVRLTDDADDYENPIVAHILPLATGEVRSRLDPEAVAAVFINSPLEEASCAQAMARAFKLTPAEMRVLIPMLSGKTVVEAAADLGVAMTTARTHLNNIFAKTGVSRQSELLKLAASIAPVTL